MLYRFWTWLAGFFGRPGGEIFSPAERLIFSYFNGEREVKADPLVLWQELMAIGPTLSIDIKVANSIHADAPKAEKAAAEAIRKVFHLAPLTNGYEVVGTLSDTEAGVLLDRFMLYAERLKKKYAAASDVTGGNLGLYAHMRKGRVAYIDWCGFWLNRERVFHRSAHAVAYGVAVALGSVAPGMNYYADITDSLMKAKLLKAQTDAARND